MDTRLELYDYLLKQGIYPLEQLIDDGKYHVLTDAASDKQYEYCVFKNRTFDVYPMLKPNFTEDFGSIFGDAA